MNNGSTANGRYTLGAIVLHWVIALLIVFNFMAASAADGARGAEKLQILANHKALGITILLLSLARLVWRWMHAPPPLLESLKSWEAALAKVVHWLFYVVMIALPLAGWLMHAAATGGMPVSWFGLFDIPGLPLAKDKATAGMFHDMHETFAKLMFALAGLHIAASIKHIVIDRDGTMRRMLPWGR
jgi:cytochrome b561